MADMLDTYNWSIQMLEAYAVYLIKTGTIQVNNPYYLVPCLYTYFYQQDN